MSPMSYLAAAFESTYDEMGFIVMYSYIGFTVIILLALAFLFTLKGKDIPVLILGLLGYTTYLIVSIITVNGMPEELMNALSPNFIVFNIFFFLAIGATITYMIMRRKALKEEKEE